MTDYSATNVDEYISGALERARPHLNELRALVKSAVPNAEEGLSYGKPWYKYHGMLAGFDAFKNHISFEIWSDELPSTVRERLEEQGYKTGKRTFQIKYDQEVPAAVIENMLIAQAADNEAKSKKS